MNEYEWFNPLVSAYLTQVTRLARELSDAFSQPDLMAGRRSRTIPRTGRVGNLEFAFHGIGCCIADGEWEVDFDFLPNGELGGFDAWRLHVFTRDNPSFAERSVNEFEAALTSLEQRGEIRTVQRSSLYVRVT